MFWCGAEIHSAIQLAKGLLVSFSSEKTVLLLFRACQTFTAFAYLPQPTKQDFEALDIARQVLLATFKANSWKMLSILHVFAKESVDCLSSLPPQPFSWVPWKRPNGLLLPQWGNRSKEQGSGRCWRQWQAGWRRKDALRLVLSKQRQVQEENASTPDCTARDKPNPCTLTPILEHAFTTDWPDRFWTTK